MVKEQQKDYAHIIEKIVIVIKQYYCYRTCY